MFFNVHNSNMYRETSFTAHNLSEVESYLLALIEGIVEMQSIHCIIHLFVDVTCGRNQNKTN